MLYQDQTKGRNDMRKKADNYLDTEAMKYGYQMMLTDVTDQLNSGLYSDSIRTLLIERKAFIEKRLQELAGGDEE
jgi:hypothetical protein